MGITNLEPKKWASNEIAFLEAKIAQIENMRAESEHIAHDIEHVCSLLRKRFDNESERKRKAKRVKEQRSKSKKKRNMAKKSIKVDSDEGTDDVIDILDDEM